MSILATIQRLSNEILQGLPCGKVYFDYISKISKHFVSKIRTAKTVLKKLVCWSTVEAWEYSLHFLEYKSTGPFVQEWNCFRLWKDKGNTRGPNSLFQIDSMELSELSSVSLPLHFGVRKDRCTFYTRLGLPSDALNGMIGWVLLLVTRVVSFANQEL